MQRLHEWIAEGEFAINNTGQELSHCLSYLVKLPTMGEDEKKELEGYSRHVTRRLTEFIALTDGRPGVMSGRHIRPLTDDEQAIVDSLSVPPRPRISVRSILGGEAGTATLRQMLPSGDTQRRYRRDKKEGRGDQEPEQQPKRMRLANTVQVPSS